jgi:hypothetical protein
MKSRCAPACTGPFGSMDVQQDTGMRSKTSLYIESRTLG